MMFFALALIFASICFSSCSGEEACPMMNLANQSSPSIVNEESCTEMWHSLLKYVANVEAAPVPGLKAKEFSLDGLDGPADLENYRNVERSELHYLADLVNGLGECSTRIDSKFSIGRLFRDRKIKYQGFKKDSLERKVYDEMFRICSWHRSFVWPRSSSKSSFHRGQLGSIRFKHAFRFDSPECIVFALEHFNFFRPISSQFVWRDNFNYVAFQMRATFY